jgi:hypothetical protein
MTIIAPKCTMCIPIFCIKGSRIGVSMMTAGVRSTRHPTIRRKMLITMRSRILLLVMAKTVLASVLGRFS